MKKKTEIKILENEKQAIIHGLIEIMGDEGQFYETETRPSYIIGLRGLYKGEIGKNFLQPSFSEIEGCEVEVLPGTSVVELTTNPEWGIEEELNERLDEALKVVDAYGDTDFFGVVIGKDLGPDVEKNDYLENVLGDAEVVAYIHRQK